ncbi:hypothetical protein COCCADRAFT_30866 [Bipolaris zeicola 26-R-13]|uniref:C2H2-type domain-containing protein n=1 Tax=Cochliobolus carbonum (strain 26-R-13) TaxID=930089 RepID=W6XYC8_COCC2|nr:uncharacterized protein COCCADRAFT_30866 [Bipolaris zeicola 26-R-13]EUC27714.1 hypothetical protein COCCADRAFT_30866 [Bipolaris zeicola 26-R-13]
MVPSPADVSLPDSLEDQPSQEDLIIHPDSDGKYQCGRCLKRFPCHEPYQYHATKHGDAIKHIYIGPKQCAAIKPDLLAFHDVYCHRSTHYVRVTISQPFGSTSSIQRIDEEVVLTFGEFYGKDFSSTEIYNYTLERMEEFDSQCCRRIPDTAVVRTLRHPSSNAKTNSIQLSPKNFLKLLRSCFACIPTPRRSRSRHWPSIPDLRATSLYPSTEATTANGAHVPVSDDLLSIESQPASWKSLGCRQDSARPAYSHPSSPAVPQTVLVEAATTYAAPGQLLIPPFFQATDVLPKGVTGIVAIGSFYSTSNGVRGHKRVNLGALLLHTRCASQLRDIVGEYTYEQLLEFEDKRMDVLDPVYSGILPDDLQIGVGEEVPLEECSPMLQAQVFNCLGI